MDKSLRSQYEENVKHDWYIACGNSNWSKMLKWPNDLKLGSKVATKEEESTNHPRDDGVRSAGTDAGEGTKYVPTSPLIKTSLIQPRIREKHPRGFEAHEMVKTVWQDVSTAPFIGPWHRA